MKWLYYLLVLVTVDSECVSFNGTNSEYSTSTSPCSDKKHIFLAPGILTAGGFSRACISRFHPEGPAHMVLTLITEDRQTVTASRALPSGDGGCVDILVPQLPNTKADLTVNIRYPEANCTWERHLTLRISSGRVVVVHTERARYRPGDTLRARVFILKADLTPIHGFVDEIWLEGPSGVWDGARTAQWLRVRGRLGIAQIQHELDDLAPSGKWTVRVKLGDGSQGSAAFWVGNYDLPPFQLSVRHARRVLRTSERLVWTVCVRYPWTEAVEGMLVIRIRGAGTTTSDGVNGIRTAVRLRAPRACHRHAAAAKRIGLDGTNPPDVVVADFSFQEEGTRIWQNTTVVTQVINKRVSLEFLMKHQSVISPGLPYKLKVKVTRWDDKPASNELLRICRSPTTHASDLQELVVASLTDVCDDATTDDGGIARVLLSADDDGSAYYRLQASLQNDSTIATPPLYLPVYRKGSIHAALGPLKNDANVIRTFVPLYLNMRNISNAITVHFVVITRGGIIYRWGTTTQCPITTLANQIQTSTRNGSCYANLQINNANASTFDVNGLSNSSDALLDRHLLRVMLPIKVTQQMCPESHLLAYFYYNGELVSSSKHFEMEECFANKVEAAWHSRQTAPGSSITLHLSTIGPAHCALTALDSAAKWIQPGPTVKDVMMTELRRLIEGHRKLTEYDAAEECFLTADIPDPPATSMELTATWLAAAGIRILGGDVTRTSHCSPPAPLMIDDVTVPRSIFSEAWLWRLVAIGANGTASTTAIAPDSITRYEASAVCITRTGVAISPPAVLQVFREFFIHADSPKRLRRGDSTIVRYRLFNYLYEPLSVQIQILTDPHLEGPSDNVETACVAARSSVARRFELRAQLPGKARVSIRAKSVRDGSCGNATTSRSEVSDEVIVQMTIDPEGVPVHDQKSMLLCGRGNAESGISEISWNWPIVQAVPGTETLTIWAIADVRGPLLADADDLVLLPRGCGEQNMARLATNLLALKQLDPRSSAAITAREHVARGFTRQLQYVHPSGGFSVFGASDDSASTWLTAFSVRYLRRAHQALTPGLPAPPALDRAERWLLSQQMENGCFRNEGQVFHRELRGGINEEGEIASVALTAYVITSLVQSTMALPFRVLRNTLSCLRALPPLKSKNPSRVYAHSLIAYALMKLRSYEEDIKKTNEAILLENGEGRVEGLKQDEEMRELVELLKLAKRNGEFVWWETGSLATSIEATGYGLLALSSCPPSLRDTSCAHDARGAIRWLSTHRNAAGGFLSTQDTLVALEALTAWSSVQPSLATNLNVTARSPGVMNVVNVRSGTKIPDVIKMRNGIKLNINVQGTGCALIQATRSYNSYLSDLAPDKQLKVQTSVLTDGVYNCDVNGTNCFCAALVEACVVWTGTFPEMALLEISLPGGFGADASLLYSQLQQPNSLLRRIELTSTSSRATLYLGTRDGSDLIGRGGHQCYKLHAVGPRAKTKPAYAKVIDYYRPAVNDTQMYTIPEECPPRISHESKDYLPLDNLFNKAKSLSDYGEIVISHEFTFEDIPEVIPLDDPLYDNLSTDILNKNETNTQMFNNESSINENSIKNSNSIKEIHERTLLDDKIEDISKMDDTIRQDSATDTKITLENEKSSGMDKSDRKDVDNENYDINKSDMSPRKSKANLDFIGQTKEISDKSIILIKADVTENEIPIAEGVQHENASESDHNTVIQNKDKIEFGHEIGIVPTTNDSFKKQTEVKEVDNPNLSDFHVIDSEKDLEVPSGIEGPVPSMVLPPPNFPRNYAMPPAVVYYTEIPYGIPWNKQIYQRPRHFGTFQSPPYYFQPVEDGYTNLRFRRYNSPTG